MSMDIDPPPALTEDIKSSGRRLLDVDAIVNRIVGEVTWLCAPAHARMAQTCKSLFIPSIRLLWNYAGDLNHLLRVLPSDSWKEEIPSSSEGSRTLNRPIKLTRNLNREDFKRMCIYAPYLTAVRYHSADSTLKPETIAAVIATYTEAFGHPHFLPNLTTLYWDTNHDSDFPLVIVFIGYQLRYLLVSISEFERSRLSFLSHIASLCPHLGTLCLQGGEDLDLIATGSSFLVGWEHLTSLRINSVSTEVMMYLSKMQTLADLTLKHIDNINWISVRKYIATLDKPSFPALNDITFQRTQSKACIEMLTNVGFPAIKSIFFCLNESVNGEQWAFLFRTFRSHCSTQLQSITAVGARDEDNPSASQPQGPKDLTIDEIRILFPFNNLMRLVISPPHLDIDDSGIKQIAKAFPRLEVFGLQAIERSEVPEAGAPTSLPLPKTTISCLQHVAELCPKIQCIHLSFDARVIKTLEEVTIQAPDLWQLSVGHSPLEDSEAVFQYLRKLFPGLIYINWRTKNGIVDDPYLKKWEEVRDKVEATAGRSLLAPATSE